MTYLKTLSNDKNLTVFILFEVISFRLIQIDPEFILFSLSAAGIQISRAVKFWQSDGIAYKIKIYVFGIDEIAALICIRKFISCSDMEKEFQNESYVTTGRKFVISGYFLNMMRTMKIAIAKTNCWFIPLCILLSLFVNHYLCYTA